MPRIEILTTPNSDPWLLRDMERLRVFERAIGGHTQPPPEKKVRQFIKDAKKAGLIRRNPLTIRQYIGALSSLNPFNRP